MTRIAHPNTAKLRAMGLSKGRMEGLSQLAPDLFSYPGRGHHREFSDDDVQRLVLASALVDVYVPMHQAQTLVADFGKTPKGLWGLTSEPSIFPICDVRTAIEAHGVLVVINVDKILNSAMSIWRA